MSETEEAGTDAFILDQLDALAAEVRALGSRVALLKRMLSPPATEAPRPPESGGLNYMGKDEG
jgi:hypothetical protein